MPETWVERVSAALAEIEEGKLKKLVLTRRVIPRGERPFEAAAVMASLRRLYTGCTLLAPRRGDLPVIPRYAPLEGDRTHLFAGRGIVAGSDPEAELAETEWKLAALVPALESG